MNVIAYEAGQWHDLFAIAGEAAAGLGGLLFVAVSLNHKDILSEPRLPPLAARSLGVLLSILLMSVMALTPGQSRTTPPWARNLRRSAFSWSAR